MCCRSTAIQFAHVNSKARMALDVFSQSSCPCMHEFNATAQQPLHNGSSCIQTGLMSLHAFPAKVQEPLRDGNTPQDAHLACERCNRKNVPARTGTWVSGTCFKEHGTDHVRSYLGSSNLRERRSARTFATPGMCFTALGAKYISARSPEQQLPPLFRTF